MDHKRKAENLGFMKEMMMISEMGSFSSMPNGASFDMGMSSSAIQDYSAFDDDLEMLIQNRTYNNINNRNVVVDRFIDIPLESLSRPPAAEYSEVVNTPNSCSISSSSTEAAAGNEDRKKTEEDDEEEEEEDEDQEKTKKQLSKLKKKKKQKKEREARFAFMTKSDVDHLDDGYRWRKYGQKAVKNSPFPRSYYRCTSTLCGVKKRVERSNEDTSTVVTTYEGTHTHPCPIMPRGSFGFMPEIAAFGGGGSSSVATPSTTRQMLPCQQQQPPYFHHSLTPPQLSYNNKDTFSSPLVRERPFCPAASTDLARDHGLLQDMLPSKMLKETKEGE